MAAQQPPFALSLALVGGNNPINYSTRAGQSLYTQAIEALPYTYEGDETSLPAFLLAVRNRAATAGWTDIFQITIGQDANNQPVLRDLLTRYREITLQNVRADAQNDYIGQQVRNAQIFHQIYQCLTKSISRDVTERLVTETEKYHVNNVPDGPSLLMTIIEIFFLKTKSTPAQTM